jgi:hypothetical protein
LTACVELHWVYRGRGKIKGDALHGCELTRVEVLGYGAVWLKCFKLLRHLLEVLWCPASKLVKRRKLHRLRRQPLVLRVVCRVVPVVNSLVGESERG